MSASTFALAQMPASLFWAALARRMPIRFLMMSAAFVVALAAVGNGGERLAAAGDQSRRQESGSAWAACTC